MNISVKVTANFKRALKPLMKKYKSILTDLRRLEQDLVKNPRMGVPLGRDAFKIRLKISGKHQGKRGGARVITFLDSSIVSLVEKNDKDEVSVYLLSIYDKSEVASISDKELRDLIKSLRK